MLLSLLLLLFQIYVGERGEDKLRKAKQSSSKRKSKFFLFYILQNTDIE